MKKLLLILTKNTTMKRLLLILLCLPMIFSCGDGDTDNLQREITTEMMNDGYTGKGTRTSLSGIKYVGEYNDGKCHGQGTCTFDGNKYVGEWEVGNMNGLGTMTFADGTVKKGLWKKDEFIGKE